MLEMTSPEDEQWARIIIFFLVGTYLLVIVSLMIRFLIKACRYSQNSDWHLTAWQHFLEESEIRRHRAPETPPPPFPAALKYPFPRTSSIGSIGDEAPPTYEEVISRLRSNKIPPLDTSVTIQAAPVYTLRENEQSLPLHVQDNNTNGEFDFKGIAVLHL